MNEPNWEKINQEKNNTILLNMSINAVLDKMPPLVVLLNKEHTQHFKNKVKALHKVMLELHKEDKNGESN